MNRILSQLCVTHRFLFTVVGTFTRSPAAFYCVMGHDPAKSLRFHWCSWRNYNGYHIWFLVLPYTGYSLRDGGDQCYATQPATSLGMNF